MKVNCKHCNNEFEQRRNNHVYCKNGCKTMASYKRNNYTYVSGSYRKKEETGLSIIQKDHPNIDPKGNKKIEKHFKRLTNKIQNIENEISNGFTNSLKAVIAAELLKQGMKKLFTPSYLPSTKGDADEIKKQNEEIQIQNNTILNWIDKQSKRQDLEDSFL
ncbi:MAG: hypothetical protein QM478_02945 [Flavobacteriaceae bacterium]